MKTCNYILVDEDLNTWECSNCRGWWTLNSNDPFDNHMKYCPLCGAKILDCKIETFEELLESINENDVL